MIVAAIVCKGWCALALWLATNYRLGEVLRALEGSSGIRQALRTPRKAFHGNEVFSPGDASVTAPSCFTPADCSSARTCVPKTRGGRYA